MCIRDSPNTWALMLDDDGFITEGTGDNFFIIKDGVVITPEGRNILRGISRDYVIYELCKELKLECVQKNIEPYDVYNADEAFMTGTPFCMLPVTSLNELQIGSGERGPIFNLILKKWSENIGLDIESQLKTWDEGNNDKYIGSDEMWKLSEEAIIKATKGKKLNYKIEYGEAAFYGPKLDFMVKDALNRKWQLGTIQVDYNLPERFDLTFKNKENQDERPVMIHRAPFGSLERFVAILIEHTAGIFPLWLTSNQILLISVGEKHEKYAEKVSVFLEKAEIRATLDNRNETVSKKIRDSEQNKIPYMGIIGDKEIRNNSISIRALGGDDIGEMNIDELINFIKKEEEKSYNN